MFKITSKSKNSQRRPVLIIFLTFIFVIIVISGLVILKSFDSQPSIGETLQKVKNTIIKENDLISGYPHECKRRMGFDNYRTFSAFTIDPQDSNTLYLAVEYKGVYKSQDGGKTWNQKSKGLRGYPNRIDPQNPCHEQHPMLVIDPQNPDRIILTSASSPGTLGDINSENGGVYESLDGGESWHQLFNETMNAWTYEALVIDPKDTEKMYVGTTAMAASYDEADPNKIFVKEGIIYKTEDRGKNWRELPTGIVPDLRAAKLFIDPNDSSHLIFTTMALPSNKGGGKIHPEQQGILETRDGGETWSQLGSLPKDRRAITAADIAPENFQNMFVSVNGSSEEEFRYYSTDGGNTFNRVQTVVNKFKFDPYDPKGLRLLGYNVFTTPRSIFESLDGGKTWHVYSSIPKEVNNESRISNIVWDPNIQNIVYLNGDEGRVWKSEDNGKTWQLIVSLETLK